MATISRRIDSTASDSNNLPKVFRWLSVILLCASSAWTTCIAVWLAHPVAYERFHFGHTITFLILISGPTLAASLSANALKNRHFQSPWTRSIAGAFITLSFLCALFVSLLTLPENNGVELLFRFIFFAALLLPARLLVGLGCLILPDTTRCWRYERRFHYLIIASVVAPLLGLLLWSLLNIPIVAWRAVTIAGDDPYCIQVPARNDGEGPLTHWGQLTGLRMRAPYEFGGVTAYAWQFSFHSVLVVRRSERNEFYKWSYFSQNFVAIPKGGLVRVNERCEPRRGFLYTLDSF